MGKAVEQGGGHLCVTKDGCPFAEAALRASIQGTFEITTAGTIVPSNALDVVAAAVVKAGSYFECINLGPAEALGGSWS